MIRDSDHPTPEGAEGALVSSVQLLADREAQQAAIDYWDMSREAHQQVLHRARALRDPKLDAACAAVMREPGSPSAARRLGKAFRQLYTGRGAPGSVPAEEIQELVRAAMHADAVGRLAAWLGDSYAAPGRHYGIDDLARSSRRGPPAERVVSPGEVLVSIVIPFRDRTASRSRLRNLLACLRALDDQSVDRTRYQAVVVESDEIPRWQETIRPMVDTYLHVRDAGHFNKAWSVNVGVVQAAGDSDLIVVLDADVLVDRDFVARNLARFGRRGAQAHLPFQDAVCCDADASDVAIRLRIADGAPAAHLDRLRGVLLRRPPGHCVWVRRELFDRVNGFDERFVGWGGEDLDFVFRLQVIAAVDRFDDDLVHLYHDRPVTQENGRRFYADRALVTWSPVGPHGQFQGPVASADDGLADLIERSDRPSSNRRSVITSAGRE